MNFNYDLAFSRNLGWIGEAEFQKIKNFKIAIAGMGGVGGSHLMALVRMGFSNFAIADFDKFEIQNFNRQFGANISTLEKDKCEVMKSYALEVNPECRIAIFGSGVTDQNINQFLDHVDLYVDGLDIFELKIRQKLFRHTRSLGIPGITVAPLGFGASCLIFDSKSMSFDRYFQFTDEAPFENLLKFVLGLAPSMMQVKYLIDRKYSNLAKGKTSSTPAGCLAASAVLCTEAVKILLQRRNTLLAPNVIHYDFYLNQMKKNRVYWGLRNPIMKLKLFVLKKMIERLKD